MDFARSTDDRGEVTDHSYQGAETQTTYVCLQRVIMATQVWFWSEPWIVAHLVQI